MTYDRLMEFLGHYKEGKLKRHLRVETGRGGVEYRKEDNIYSIRGYEALMEFVNPKEVEGDTPDVLILYYADMHKSSNDFLYLYKQYARKFLEDKKPYILFGMIDVAKNDLMQSY